MIFKRAESKTEIIEYANIALRSRLYVSGWNLSGVLVKIKRGLGSDKYKCIILAYDDSSPVGVCVLYITKYRSCPYVAVFVKSQYRGKGIGSQLVKEAINDIPYSHFIYGHGLDNLDKFWGQFPNGIYEI